MRNICITSLLVMVLLANASGCSSRSDDVTGQIVSIHEKIIEILLLNKTSGKVENPVGEVLAIEIDDHTVIETEHHHKGSLEELKVGHKIKAFDIKRKNKNYIAGKIQLLELTSDDIISSMLAPADKYHILVIADSKDEQAYEVFNSLLSEYSPQNYNFSFKEIDPDYPYDISKILDLEQLPAYLVLDSKGLLAKHYDENDLRTYISRLRN